MWRTCTMRSIGWGLESCKPCQSTKDLGSGAKKTAFSTRLWSTQLLLASMVTLWVCALQETFPRWLPLHTSRGPCLSHTTTSASGVQILRRFSGSIHDFSRNTTTMSTSEWSCGCGMKKQRVKLAFGNLSSTQSISLICRCCGKMKSFCSSRMQFWSKL